LHEGTDGSEVCSQLLGSGLNCTPACSSPLFVQFMHIQLLLANPSPHITKGSRKNTSPPHGPHTTDTWLILAVPANAESNSSARLRQQSWHPCRHMVAPQSLGMRQFHDQHFSTEMRSGSHIETPPARPPPNQDGEHFPRHTLRPIQPHHPTFIIPHL